MSGASPLKILGYPIPGFLVVAASTWLSRLLATAISLVSIRIVLDTIGVEHYAVYAVLMGTVSWFMLADMGTGQSLQNYISEDRATKQGYANDIVATAAITVVVIVIGIVVITILGGWPALHLLSQFDFLSDKDKYLSFTTVAVLVILTAGGSLIYRIWYAEHKGYLANIVLALSAVVALVGIYGVAESDVENKLYWCLIAANAPMAVLSIGSLMVRLSKTTGTSVEIVKKQLVKILRRGSRFWLFNVAAAGVMQIDFIVLSQYAPADQIVAYSISMKVFGTMAFMTGAVLQAFWPVCAEELANGNWLRIKLFIKRYLFWSVSFVVFFTFMFSIFNKEVYSIFSSKENVVIPKQFIILVGVMFIIRVWTDVFAVILQSINDMNILLLWAMIQAFIGFFLQIMLVPNYGIYGTIFALSLSWLLTVSWLLPKRVWHLHNKMTANLA